LPRKSKEASLDRRLIKALGHPVRVRALEVLNVRVASPSELAKELSEPSTTGIRWRPAGVMAREPAVSARR